MYIVTDAGKNETGALVKVNPGTLEKTVLLNNYYQQPFMGFNDLDIDKDGNFLMTDSKSADVRRPSDSIIDHTLTCLTGQGHHSVHPADQPHRLYGKRH